MEIDGKKRKSQHCCITGRVYQTNLGAFFDKITDSLESRPSKCSMFNLFGLQ